MNAREWLASGAASADVVLLGAPISKASISPSQAWSTPEAFRRALARFPTWDAEHAVDVATLGARDLGDVRGDRDDPDASGAHERIHGALADAAGSASVVVVIGGDNSLTRPALQGLTSAQPGVAWGLLTLDAHHDCRPADQGSRNGTPVRELIEAGLPGNRVAQVGIHPFGNRREHADWAAANGIHVFPLARVRELGIEVAVDEALAALVAAGAACVYVDLDIDVVDRASAPACPASMPGGLSPAELLAAAHRAGYFPGVAAADICEVDANADVNGITVRLAAAAFLALCSGVASR